jgi:hypothetical protein
MTFGDTGNGIFEFVGGLMSWLNVRRIRHDKKVSGVDWRVFAFWVTWGIWNLWYYPSLDQWLSFIGGWVVVTANAVWLYYAIKYRKE